MTGWSRVVEIADRTPASRDRFADFLRGLSILVVVLGHWLIAVVTWREGSIEGTNALEVIDGLWIATWILQVMPVFFFVGGFANARSWDSARRRGERYAHFLANRIRRMLRPTGVFLAVALTVIVILDALNLADDAVFPASELIARPLWFLGVYMIVVALAPPMLALHRRTGWRAVAGMVLTVALVDLLTLGFDVTAVGYLNYGAAWLLAHQLGFFYADGDLLARLRWPATGAGLAGLVLLVNLGPYPGSMVGLGRDEISNMDPPTIAIVALMFFQIGLAMVLRAPVTRWLRRVRVWAAVIYVNTVIMTVFLWHLTAMLLGIGVLYPLGFPQPDAGTSTWWMLRPVWVAVLIAVLAVFVLLFGRFEARAHPGSAVGPRRSMEAVLAVTGAILVIVGVLGFAMGGMHQLFSTSGTRLVIFNVNPMLNVLHIAIGTLLLEVAAGTVRRIPALPIGTAALSSMVALALVVRATGVSDPLATNVPDIVLHVAAAAVASSAWLLSSARPDREHADGSRADR